MDISGHCQGSFALGSSDTNTVQGSGTHSLGSAEVCTYELLGQKPSTSCLSFAQLSFKDFGLFVVLFGFESIFQEKKKKRDCLTFYCTHLES